MKKGKIFYGWWIVIGSIIVTTTTVPLVMALANKYLVMVTTDLAISRSSYALSNTIVQLLGIVLSPIVSRKLAKGNLKLMQGVGIIGFCLSYAAYSIVQNALQLYLVSFLLGLFFWSSTLLPVSFMITNWFHKKRGLAMSLAMTGIGVGGAIFSPIITSLLSQYGWRSTYQIMAGLVLIFALPVVLFIFKKAPADMGLKPYGADEQVATNSEKKDEEKQLTLSMKQSYSKLFFWLLALGMFLNGLINTGALAHFPPAIEEAHGPALQAAIISTYSFVGIFGKLALGWINDHFGVVKGIIFGCTGFAIAFICMLISQEPVMLYVMAIAFGLGTPLGSVSPPLVTISVFGEKNYAAAYGIITSIFTIGSSCGSLLIAGVFDSTGSYQAAWLILLVMTVLTAVSWIGSYKLSRKYAV